MISDLTVWIFTARKRSLRRLCFYRCLSFCPQEGACMVAWGACVVARECVVAPGGACMVAPRGVCVVARGACVVAPGRGHASLLLGGHAWFSGGCAWFFRGGVRGFFDEIRSMTGRYASYWNAFLFVDTFPFQYQWHKNQVTRVPSHLQLWLSTT